MSNKEENEMSILEKNLISQIDNIKRIAKSNTVKNNEGLTVVTKNDPIREELDWDSSVKQYDNQSK